MARKRIKLLQRALARYGFLGSSWLFNKLPYGFVKVLMRGFIAVGYFFAVKQKRIAKESLDIAFEGALDQKAIDRVTRQCFENLGRGMIELIYFMDHPEMITQNVSFEGKEHLDQALAEGKGVVTFSAHFGSFPLMLLRCVREGYATNAIIRRTRDEKLEEHFLALRTRLGLKTIYAMPRQTCVEQSLKALRNNEVLFIPMDQNFGSGAGVFVDFFGRKAATATGPVVFARRTGAPILPVFIIRQSDDTHKIIIEPPLTQEEGGTDEQTTYETVSKITQVIERYIREYPQEWGWMHRRWKTQPKTMENQK